MLFIVPGMKLIPQDKTMSCWFASGQMLIQWRQNRLQACETTHPDPSLVKKWNKLYDDNPGITNAQIAAFAKDMGFEMLGAMTPSPEYIERLLSQYGPLWVNGNSHITVIAGIRSANGGYEVLVYDPARPNLTHGKWHDFYAHYGLQAHTTMDSSSASETSMLYLKSKYQ